MNPEYPNLAFIMLGKDGKVAKLAAVNLAVLESLKMKIYNIVIYIQAKHTSRFYRDVLYTQKELAQRRKCHQRSLYYSQPKQQQKDS